MNSVVQQQQLKVMAGLIRQARKRFAKRSQGGAGAGNRLEIPARSWQVEPYSNRQASIRQTAISPGHPVLFVELTGGRGDSTYLGRELELEPESTELGLAVNAFFENQESMTMGVVLTTERERPWLELPAIQLSCGNWQTLYFDLSQLKTEKLAKVDRINLVITTGSDEARLMIDRIRIS